MELSWVRAFIAVVDCGSLTAAAKRLSVSKQSVSRQLNELERELGTPLLVRTTRRLSLTDDGEVFLVSARQAMEQLDNGVALVNDRRAEATGTLIVGCPALFGRRFLAPVVHRFLRENPGVKIMMRATSPLDHGLFGDLDVLIVVGSVEDRALRAIRIGSAFNGFFASPGYIRKHGQPTHPQEIVQFDALVYSLNAGQRIWRVDTKAKAASNAVSVKPNMRLVSSEAEDVLGAAMAGLGIAFLPTFITCDAVRRGRLIHVLPEWTMNIGPIRALYAASRVPRRSLRLFCDHMAREFKTNRPWEGGPLP